MAEDRWSAIVDTTSTDVNSVSPLSGTKMVSPDRAAEDSLPATASDMWSRACEPRSEEQSAWDADDIPSLDNLDDGLSSLPEARVFVAPNIVPLFVVGAEGTPGPEQDDGDRTREGTDSLRPTALPIEDDTSKAAPAPRSIPFTLITSLAVACLLLLTLTTLLSTQHRPLVRAAAAASAPLEPVDLAAPKRAEHASVGGPSEAGDETRNPRAAAPASTRIP